MTPEQYRQARDLFEQAIDLDPAGMRDWLAGLPAEPAVVAEVRSLLDHHTRADAFLAEPISSRVPSLFDDTPQFAPGTRLGVYEIVREIGRGGMGRIYLATDTRLGRTVALKALPPAVAAQPSQRERLRREARAAASLTHPGICTIYALEEIGDDVLIAAEYIDGVSLREEIGRGRPPADVVMATARELALALASAHASGITHRDLKPENVMRARNGHIKILDFGLALIDPASAPAAEAHSPRVTLPGAVIGTPAYMAPEQLNGDPATARTDVFALGVLLYELATGSHPFEAPTPLALAGKILEGEPTPLEQLRPDLPPALAAAIGRAMRKDPVARFASAADFGAALEAIETAPGAASDAGTTWWRTHQFVAIGLYLIAVAVAWQAKEWLPGVAADILFLVVGILATVASVFRGHLVFAERMNRASFDHERRRAAPVTLAADLVLAVALAGDGIMLAATRPLAGLLTMALGIGIGLARFIVEPSTTRGAFDDK